MFVFQVFPGTLLFLLLLYKLHRVRVRVPITGGMSL